MKRFIWILLVIFTLGILGLLFHVGTQSLTNKEVVLFTIILTVLSILATWIASYYYSESTYKAAVQEVDKDHQTKLKIYALKAAEKVNNLSSELNKLSNYLQQELDVEYDNLPQENYSREERIRSAIHIVNILKSVNDTALSDWKGVIGDELEEQEEEKKEREDALLQIVDRYETLISELRTDYTQGDHYLDQTGLREEITSLKTTLGMLINNLSGTTVVRPRTHGTWKQEITTNCPVCSSPNTYQQRPKKNSAKLLSCKKCQTKLVSRWNSEKGFFLEVETRISEQIDCPSCHAKLEIQLSSFPNNSETIVCSNCSATITASRTTASTVVLKAQHPIVPTAVIPEVIDEEYLNQIRSKLPEQPWPVGIHKSIADELHSSSDKVHSAINELIARGEYYPQFGGKLYREMKKE